MSSPLTVVCGNACTGKTTWAKDLSERTGATLLDIDTVSERLVEAAQRELGRDAKDRDSPDYKRVYRDVIHETLFAIARDNVGPVIIVAPFTLERRRDDFESWLIKKVERPVRIHYFVSKDAVRKQRILDRNNPRDLSKIEEFTAYAAIGQEDARPRYPHDWFDTSEAFPEVQAYLANQGGKY
jgi:predicted kinase